MQIAGDQTVLGNFTDSKFDSADVTATFFRRDGRFFVNTEGPDGRPADFEISYTFGIEPLQQYLIGMPGGRLQALGIAWDTRPKPQGGQRWFHLYPGERLRAGERLHWTGIDQNWNHMCADCHSTDLRKNYDPVRNAFDTQWSEIHVGCEACHGPASQHLEWARRPRLDPLKGLTAALDERRGIVWAMDPESGNAVRSAARATDREIEVCAQCHARRAQIADGYRPGERFLDHYLPALLQPPLYHVDGQQQGEAYNWGSFLQSRMFDRGVTCSDCHEPHSQQLRADGNAVCAQCHQPQKYDSAAHHFHKPATPAAQCVSCHMPAATYMVVDRRHDHSLRVPRPDLSMELGTPNACNGCHSDRSATWANAAVLRWYGRQPEGFQQFAEKLNAAARGGPLAVESLSVLAIEPRQSNIVRATAVNELAAMADGTATNVIASMTRHSDPLIRVQAASGLERFAPEQRLALGAPLLNDPVRAVRIEAARALAPLKGAVLTTAQTEALRRAVEELRHSMRISADRPETRVMSAVFESSVGNDEAAVSEFETALRIDPGFVPAYVNLAEMWRTRSRDDLAEQTLRRGIAARPDEAVLHHSLGLTLIRGRYREAGMTELARAVALAPEDRRFAYVYAVGLNSMGRVAQALQEIDRALRTAPDDRDLLWAAAVFRRDSGDLPGAVVFARRLTAKFPRDPDASRLVEELTRGR